MWRQNWMTFASNVIVSKLCELCEVPIIIYLTKCWIISASGSLFTEMQLYIAFQKRLWCLSNFCKQRSTQSNNLAACFFSVQKGNDTSLSQLNPYPVSVISVYLNLVILIISNTNFWSLKRVRGYMEIKILNVSFYSFCQCFLL